MKTYSKKIITLLLALLLVFCSTVSLSSCSYTVGFLGSVFNNIGSDDADESLTAQRSALLSSVAIIANFEIESYPGSVTESRSSAGSGVIYKLNKSTGDAYIITNYHVVYNNNAIDDQISHDIKVYLYGLESDSYAIIAEYVGGSPNYDIAVLKVTGCHLFKETPVKEAILADSELLRVLDPVIAVGNAEGEGFSATKGSVSVESEYLTMKGADKVNDITVRVIRVDTPINEGNSGGGLFDSEGRLVGIVNAKKIGDKVDNIGYAIPINLATKVTENIIYHSNDQARGMCKYLLGITITEAERLLDVDNSGEIVHRARVTVTDVVTTSPVYGSVKAGDSILEITVDGKTEDVFAMHHVTESMLNARPGSTVTIVIERSGETHNVTVTITSEMGVMQ